MNSERGSGTILVLTILGVAGALMAALSAGGSLAIAQAKLQAQTDAAAIGANQVLRGLSTGYPCEVANQFLQLDMASLQTCSIVGEETHIVATVQVMGIVLTAKAWSAPLKPPQQ
jgi:opacity protein-like surface antigen